MTYFEESQAGLKQRLVSGTQVLLNTGLAEALCDTLNEGPVFGEGLCHISLALALSRSAVFNIHRRKHRKPPRHPGPR